ncbi:DUF3253 domain-containing protein [Yoonia sp. 2307UL14-13]|uniref:DUF3253 domain-containing protein n=1 Tax=Yoonia sp. 2307UL14-13 TaxID=3126506 RepID=UPI003097EE79
MINRSQVAAALIERAAGLRPDTTFCPSEVARALTDDWRPLMPLVRDVAADLSELRVTQKGQPVDPRSAKGPIRLGRA